MEQKIHSLSLMTAQMKPVETNIHIGKMPKFIIMKNHLKWTSFVAVLILLQACTSAQISSALKTYEDYQSETIELTNDDVIAGLKEALVIGAENSIATTSAIDGFLQNPKINIPFPPEIQEVEDKLRQLGMSKLVDDFTVSINRAAEKAAGEAMPLFLDAITEMTIEDGWNILKGEQDAATEYLRKTTSPELERRFRPIIDDALASVHATRYYEDITTIYNKIPLVTKVDTDLTNYVMQKALDGLFLMVAQEEAKIRQDPVARTTDLLKRVFSEQE